MLDNKPSESQKFVDKYMLMRKDFTDEEELFQAVVNVIKEEKLQAEATKAIDSVPLAEKTESFSSMYGSAIKQKQKQNKINLQDLLTEKE